jgi:uncharacterized caspase-like protein
MRILQILLIIIFQNIFLHAQCLSGDCVNGKGTYQKRIWKYTGQFKNGKPEGKGKMVFSDGRFYEGDFMNGKFHGNGTMYLDENVQIKGSWRNGVTANDVNTTAKVEKVQPSRPKVTHSNTVPKVWALAVGVAAYDPTVIKPLKFTDDDAYRMLNFWKSPGGGSLDDEHAQALVDEAATKENIVKTLNEMFLKAGPNDLVIFYFSGHGLTGAFLPVDYDGVRNKLLHSEVQKIFAKCPAKFKLCIADACHSGSLLAQRADRDKEMIDTYYKALSEASGGTALLMSSKADEDSLESTPLRQGVFSHFLLRGIKGEADANGDKIVTIQELFNYVKHSVDSFAQENNRSQTPCMEGSYDKNMPVSVKK